MTVGGPFFLGNLVTCSHPAMRLGLLEWTKDGLSLELNNPTDQPLEATIATAPEIKDHFQVQAPGEGGRRGSWCG